jgi:hypothetical protein
MQTQCFGDGFCTKIDEHFGINSCKNLVATFRLDVLYYFSSHELTLMQAIKLVTIRGS